MTPSLNTPAGRGSRIWDLRPVDAAATFGHVEARSFTRALTFLPLDASTNLPNPINSGGASAPPLSI
jgi:hypothetical protein